MQAIFINDFRLARNESRLYCGEQAVELQPKCTELLVALAARPGEVISKETLLEQVWRGRVVGDDVLTTSIRKLRIALNDDAKNPQYIETINKKGYRLIARVGQPEAKASFDPFNHKRWWAAGMALVVGVVMANLVNNVEVYRFSDADTPEQRAAKLQQLNERVLHAGGEVKSLSFEW